MAKKMGKINHKKKSRKKKIIPKIRHSSSKKKVSRREKTKKIKPKRVFKKKTKQRKIKSNSGGNKIYYGLNPKFEFLEELKNLILTSPPASFSRMAKRISGLGRIKLVLVSGVFLNKENVADLLIVGDDVDRRRFKKFLETLEAEVGTQLLYAIMDNEEFSYRRAMFDRFVRLMLEGPHEVLIDKIGL